MEAPRARPSGRSSCCARSSTFDYDEIAAAVDKTPVAVRRPRAESTPGERDRVLERFMVAASTGDIQSLLDVLAPDVVLVTGLYAVRNPAKLARLDAVVALTR